jgi:IclR family pca regulon transcriptional regulator
MTEQRTATRSTDDLEPADDQMRSISKSLVKGLAILACFNGERSLLGISDLADELGGSRSTTHRYACTLVELGYLEQDAKRRYRLGLKAADIGMSALNSIDLGSHSRRHLERLRKASSLTVSLAILDDPEVVCIEHLPGHQTRARELETPIGHGSRLPAYCTATGKMLLAMLDDEEQRHLLRSMKLTKHGPRTIATKQALKAELEEVARTQLAIADQEVASGLLSLAAPVYDDQERAIAAVGVTAPSELWTAQRLRRELGATVTETAAKISIEARRSQVLEGERPARMRARAKRG